MSAPIPANSTHPPAEDKTPPSGAPPPDNEAVDLTQLSGCLAELEQSFEQVSRIAEGTDRDGAIAQEAERLHLSATTYRHRLDAYIQGQNPPHPTKTQALLKSVSILDARMGDFVGWLEQVSLIKLATVLGESAILIALFSYFLTFPQRQQETIFEARQIIASQSEQKHSQSRIEALEKLNQMCMADHGLQAPEAELVGLQLNHCHQFQFNLERLSQWPVQLFQYEGMDLAHANLQGANLAQADLRQANLKGSNLQGANLAGVNLAGANLAGANLTDANLVGATLDGAIFERAVLKQTVLNGASLQGADLSRAMLSQAEALWANFQGAQLYRANLRQANLNRANFSAADLYKAQLQQSQLRFVNFQDKANLRGANLSGADASGADFWSVTQLKRAHHWTQATKSANWDKQVALQRSPRLRIGLIKSTQSSIFRAYELGMRRAANRRVEIWGIQTQAGVAAEAQAIEELMQSGIDAIVLVPEDPIGSRPAIQAAHAAGVVVITVDFCFEDAATQRLVFACYNTDSFQMGYDSGQYLAQWARQQLAGKALNVGLVDSANYDRYYPNLQGFLAAMDDAGITWTEMASTDATDTQDVDQVIHMLRDYPEINVLWGGSNTATEIAVEAVQRLGRADQVAVFGILDLSQQKAQWLLDPNSPLQSIIDQAGVDIGYRAVKTAISVLQHERSGYEFHPVQHRLLTQADQAAVRDLLSEANSIR